MANETKNDQPAGGEWTMPDPVFRSTEGFTPGIKGDPIQDEIPTEPGFSDDTTEEYIGINDAEDEGEKHSQSVRATTKTRVRHPKKKSGCAKTFGLIAGAIAFSVIAIIAVAIYFLVFYKPTDTSF